MKGLIFKLLGIYDLIHKIERQQKQIDFLNSLCKVGVDFHGKPYADSWAVVCIQGKPDYINFFMLKNRDAQSIKYFLRDFAKKNITIDCIQELKEWMIS